MGAPWPISLPDFLESEGFTYKPGNNSIRTEMDISLAKTRKRYTKPIDSLTASMKLSSTQVATLLNFYYVTLSGGNLRFDFIDPLTQTLSEYRFLSPPDIRSIGADYFNATLSWEKMP